ncbi:TRAP transporter substrate-binding protein [Amorphus coralli]|uniref:TRAP transporter substrate-binding protein n=1 Tax=Amorphus coralli TaxID=340680 RepID=UPI00037F3402|nr:TRAP transporter substrate-binding protein [Amorphus coralli]
MAAKLLGLALGLAFAGAVTAQAQDTTINLGHVTQPSHPFHTGAEMFKEAVEAKTDGAVEVKIFPSRQLGDDKELLEGVRLGTVDAAVISSAIFGGSTPLMDSLQLPFLIENYDDLSVVLTSDEAQALLDGLSEIDLKGLGYYEGGQRHFLANGTEATTIDAMQGLKTRVVPAKLHLDIWNEVGVSPTPMPYGEIYTSLQTGVLDATEINLTSIFSEKLYEVADNAVLTSHYFWPGVLVINPTRFAGLSEEQQAAIIAAAEETIAPQIAAAKEQDADARGKIEAEGVTVSEFQQLPEVREKLQGIYETYEAKDPRVKAFADKARSVAQD